MSIPSVQLGWAAGFLEGEGSFTNHGSPCVSAGQVQREPLDRLLALFGGRISQRAPKGYGNKPMWIWALPSARSAQVMMTLYCLMSPRRQGQIAAGLAKWKRGRLFKRRESGECVRGHTLSADNIYVARGRYIRCKKCVVENKRRYRQRRAAAA